MSLRFVYSSVRWAGALGALERLKGAHSAPFNLCAAIYAIGRVVDDRTRHWRKISRAQQLLFYSILRWNLPHPDRAEDPTGGLVFDFLEDQHLPSGMIVPAMSGHDEGLITIRAAEADDATREEARQSVHELYRTLLGHLRHESGHFVWNKLVRDGNDLENYRSVFGDERTNYEEALQHYYANGPLLGWQQSFVSAYASSHPWEDFAECFAHYIHIVDSLETAREFASQQNRQSIWQWQHQSILILIKPTAPNSL